MAEATGRTVEEAIDRALEQLGASREESTVEILQVPRPALLGFGGRDARVRVTVLRPADVAAPALPSVAAEVVREIVARMGLDVSTTAGGDADRVEVVLTGRDVSAVIGRHGQTLDAIEFLVALVLGNRLGRRVAVALDAGGYRGKREHALHELARKAANRVVRERRPVFLDPMTPRERRVVHLALRDDPRVTTSSVGEGDDRRVVVHPAEGRPGVRPEGAPEGVDDEEE